MRCKIDGQQQEEELARRHKERDFVSGYDVAGKTMSRRTAADMRLLLRFEKGGQLSRAHRVISGTEMRRRGTIRPRARSSPVFASKRATMEGREKKEEEEREKQQRGPGARAATAAVGRRAAGRWPLHDAGFQGLFRTWGLAEEKRRDSRFLGAARDDDNCWAPSTGQGRAMTSTVESNAGREQADGRRRQRDEAEDFSVRNTSWGSKVWRRWWCATAETASVDGCRELVQ
ncbi:hypothetical protein TgHK011_007346 [Trichoderma gracile]|nr:hypothetical protein TgHK011_007346 [Trichoderma gracile]